MRSPSKCLSHRDSFFCLTQSARIIPGRYVCDVRLEQCCPHSYHSASTRLLGNHVSFANRLLSGRKSPNTLRSSHLAGLSVDNCTCISSLIRGLLSLPHLSLTDLDLLLMSRPSTIGRQQTANFEESSLQKHSIPSQIQEARIQTNV